MDTYASTVAQNENTFIPKGKGIGGVTADLPKPEKQDCEDTNSLVDLPKPANHLESEEVEASSLKRKSSQQGTETTKRAQTSNICTGNLSRISYAGPPVEKIDGVTEAMLKPNFMILPPRLEQEILGRMSTVSPSTSDSDEDIPESPGAPVTP